MFYFCKVVAEPRKTPGFLASGREEFNPGPETRLARSELLCNKVSLKYKRIEKASDIDIRREQKEYPPVSVSIGVIYLLSSYCNESKECLEVVKILLDPLPQFTFKIIGLARDFQEEETVLKQDTLLLYNP